MNLIKLSFSPPYILIFVMFLLLLFYQKHNTTKNYLPEKYLPIRTFADTSTIQTIKKINTLNSKIKNFHANLDIRFENNRFIKVQGTINYEKQRNFKMKIWSIFGLENEIGANQNFFWFWSKRLNPPALYYARYEDMEKTRLKTPFHPLWMMESLGFDNLPTQNIFVEQKDNLWIIYETRQSAVGKNIEKRTLVDPKRMLILGHYVFEDQKLVASTEVQKHMIVNGQLVPQQMHIVWYDEKIVMNWYFNNIAINNHGSYNWEIPDYKLKINMAD